MASAIIHLCVAKEVNKYLNMDETTILEKILKDYE